MPNTDTDAPCLWLFWLCSDSPDQTEKNPLINTNTHTTAECNPCSFAKKIKLASGGVFVWISHAASPLHECVCLSVCPGATKYMHTAHPVHWCASVCLHLQWRAQVLAQLALRLLLAFPSAIKIRIRYEFIEGETHSK